MSEKTKTIYDRLAEIQKELKAPKSQKNTFANFNYRSCEDILNAVKPLLKGLVLTLDDELVLIGKRYYVKAVAKLSDGKNTIISKAYAREAKDKKGMDASQITGAASSYARKYALNGLFAIDDEKDADAQKPTPTRGKTNPPPAGLKPVVKPMSPNGKVVCELCGATGKYHKKDCPNRPKES